MSKLVADSINLQYGTKTVLSDIYAVFEIGNVVGILGRNGAGKSSLLKIIFGTLEAQSQFIRLDEERAIRPYMKDGLMSFLPQDDFVPGYLKVKTVLRLFSVDEQRLLADFPGFEKLLHTRVKYLAGGERRLLETYIILKKKVKFVLLDEPFSYLMPLYIEKLKEIIKIEKAHKCIVITDHMYRDVEQLSDVLYLISDGKMSKVEKRQQLVDLGYLSFT